MRAALYARVSTTDRQRPETQLRKLREYAKRREFDVAGEWTDRASGRKEGRPRFKELLEVARRRDVDVVIVAAYDRLSRSLHELVNTVAELEALGVDLVSIREGTDTTTPQGRLLFGFMATLAEFESALIGERVKVGLERARAEGKVLGRPRTTESKRRRTVELRESGRSLREIAGELGIGHSTVARILRAHEKSHGVIRVPKVDQVRLTLELQNRRRRRGKKKSREMIELFVLPQGTWTKPDPDGDDYIIEIAYHEEHEIAWELEPLIRRAGLFATTNGCRLIASVESETFGEVNFW